MAVRTFYLDNNAKYTAWYIYYAGKTNIGVFDAATLQKTYTDCITFRIDGKPQSQPSHCPQTIAKTQENQEQDFT